MSFPKIRRELVRRDAIGAEKEYLNMRADYLDSLRDQHRDLRNRKDMTPEKRAEIIDHLHQLADKNEEIKVAGLAMYAEQPLCRTVCENFIGFFNGGVNSAFAIGCKRNRKCILALASEVASEGSNGVKSEKIDGALLFRG
ncbi:hypothetical protein N7508_006993 [Penicillium antarcticum]|uniref:uncharacterized protein n=1 Tax=Penicillium antarcticum TaxID=416450 RepID=UPI0023A12EE3|nr:uncharacterized protein N7508_006993 [Penicillium antarcticum]KAJ5302130.1 hypothetical protein N7508_006993 [Penicillium antarcticum]